MLYKLARKFLLRGWKGASCMLADTENHHLKMVSNNDFSVLLICDGVTDIDTDILSDDEIAALKKYENDKIIEQIYSPQSIDEEQKYKLYDNRFVNSIFWSVTGRCNFRCRHCYMDSPQGKLGELSTVQAMSLIDQMAECGVQRIELTGGEPFVRTDIWDLIDRIIEKGIYIDQIYSNGWLVNEELLQNLEKRNIKPAFSFSFDGVGWHDWMRGVQDAEKATLNALRLCKEHGFMTSVETCLHKGSICNFSETVRVLSELTSSVKCGLIMDTDLWKANSEGYGLSRREYADAMLEYIPEFYKNGMPMRVMIGGMVELKENSVEYRVAAEKGNGTEACLNKYMCGAARMAAYISPEGRLLPCMPLTSWKQQELFPKIQDIGLKKGLSDSFYMQFVNGRVKDLFEANEQCNACEYKYKCTGGCRANAVEDNTGLYGTDPWQCLMWKEGYVERIHQTVDEAIAKYCN